MERLSVLTADELRATFVPVAIYWIYSAILEMLEGASAKYSLHSKAEENAMKMLVPKRSVVKGVLLHQTIQISLSLFVFALLPRRDQRRQPPVHVIALQFFVGMVLMDSWQYFVHRTLHMNNFLYKHIHSKHHKLIVPYAFGAQYLHPLEGLFSDGLAGALAVVASGMTPRTATFFISFSTVKAIDDHSELWVPWNLLHLLFRNNSAYHRIHHQPYGMKFNFSNPFFVTWDKLLGTSLAYSLQDREGGGLEVRPLKKMD
ncbi:Sphinganine C(4)-monooxygenase 2 [Apostasia shenzhenica]|uniref:aldehyde oxygenase (deformylating) n=1 Tax=Apostasia shenzhenica TaxID=1088818 RepID=A0A2I0BBR3_9ASPA|nr:Sphinganine C(4)-monooxygenase 2 [Apostasia shenzhenica]